LDDYIRYSFLSAKFFNSFAQPNEYYYTTVDSKLQALFSIFSKKYLLGAKVRKIAGLMGIFVEKRKK